MIKIKACYICGEIKSVGQYYKSKGEYADGSINWCKECILMYHRMRKEKAKKTRYVEPPVKPHEFSISFD